MSGDHMKESIVNGIGCLLGQEVIEPSRKTIVFVHGAGGNHRMWSSQVEYLSRRFNTVAINLPGHGLGRDKGETTIGGYVNAVEELTDGLGLKKIVLGGQSMGGSITQQFALTYPQRLIAIILFSTGARMRVLPQIFDTVKNDYAAHVNNMPFTAFAESTPREIIEPVLEEARKRDPEVVYGDYLACDAFDILDRVKEIKLPCLIFSGGKDVLTPPKYLDFLNKQIAGSKLVRFENAGHMLYLEKPDEVNKAIEEFLGTLQ
jgi:pimeloyl-ACP methyl ester carboxylesterase